jgi:hypothetical protein
MTNVPVLRNLAVVSTALCLGCASISTPDCASPRLTEDEVRSIALAALESRGFKISATTPISIRRTSDCDYFVVVRYAPNRPGGHVAVRVDDEGTVQKVIYGM